MKRKWICSGMTSGEGTDACPGGHGKKHKENSASTDKMCVHPFYAKYLSWGAENLRAREGYFENLDMFCALAFDRQCDVSVLVANQGGVSLFIWNEESMGETKKRVGV